LVTLGAFVPAMRDSETPATAGTTWLLARTALRGAGGLDADGLALAAESLGGSIAPLVARDAAGWRITVPAEHARAAAQLIRAVALEPALAEGDFAVERGLQAADAARVRDDMFRYPLQRVLAEAYPGDPAGLPGLGTPDGVRQLDRAQITAAGTVLREQRAVVVAVGDLDPDRLLEAVEPLAEWPGRTAAPRRTGAGWAAGRGVERRDREQTALAMAFPAVPADSPRRHAIEVLSALLSGLAGRLFHALREERALAYTVMATPWLGRRAGAMLTYIATSPEREAEARDAMLAELARVAAGEVTKEEVAQARVYAAGQVQLSRQTGSGVAGEILEAWLVGLLDELPAVPAELRAVSREAVVAEAAALFQPASRAEFVVRGGKGGD
jgi:zinc protease